MPQLLFRPSQQCNEPPFSLWSQQWTGPPFSFWTQALFAKANSKKLSAITSVIEVWCFAVYSIAANRVLTLARAGRLEQNLSARLIYLEMRKIGGWLESRRKFQMIALSLGSVSKCQDREIYYISGTNALWAHRCWQRKKSGWQIAKIRSFILTRQIRPKYCLCFSARMTQWSLFFQQTGVVLNGAGNRGISAMSSLCEAPL